MHWVLQFAFKQNNWHNSCTTLFKSFELLNTLLPSQCSNFTTSMAMTSTTSTTLTILFNTLWITFFILCLVTTLFIKIATLSLLAYLSVSPSKNCWWCLGNITGNPGVCQPYLDPNPPKPIPRARVRVFMGWGHGFLSFKIACFRKYKITRFGYKLLLSQY